MLGPTYRVNVMAIILINGCSSANNLLSVVRPPIPTASFVIHLEKQNIK
jgi:hypothetical protein